MKINNSNKIISPFLKWPGGKRWLVPHLLNIVKPNKINNYYEPFLGGGAVFFSLKPKSAQLSDINKELIETYIQVRDNPKTILAKLKKLPIDKKTYYKIRNNIPSSPKQKAIRFLYLNRTAFSGLYRVNKNGKFNVPYGGGERTTESLWRKDLIINASSLLSKTKIIHSDFEKALDNVTINDLVYCDPTYTTYHNNNGFKRYNEKYFSWEDQKRLANVCLNIAHKGALVIISNANHKEIINLYPNAKILQLTRNSLICPTPSKRKMVSECLIILKT